MSFSVCINQLKEELRKTFYPHQISINTTKQLSSEIFNKTQKNISYSTLNRVFNFVKVTTTPSVSSLDILAEYVGYRSWADFCTKKESRILTNESRYVLDRLGFKLFEINLKNRNYESVLEYLKLLPIDDSIQEMRIEIGRLLGKTFRRDIVARKKLLPMLAKLPEGRFYFYEIFVDMEFLHIYFADSLKDYERWIDAKDKRISQRDQIFVNSLRFLNFFINNQKKNTLKAGYQLINIIKPDRANLEEIAHSFPLARYHTSYIIYLFLGKRLTTKMLDKSVEIIIAEIEKTQSELEKLFLLSELFRALYLIGHYADIVHFYKKYPVDFEKTNNNNFELYLYKVSVENSFKALGLPGRIVVPEVYL